jgi:hypothetical protein
MEQEKINSSIGCGVNECKFNVNGCNCSLSHIHVGNAHDAQPSHCTCCDSYEEKR